MSEMNQKYSQEQIDRIIHSPRNYKICLICKDIIGISHSSCPHCYGYRFQTESEEIVNHALTLAKDPKTAISTHERYED